MRNLRSEEEFETNMTEAELFENMLSLKSSCESCREAHYACRVLPECHKCEKRFWINKLTKHFGIVENVN